MHAHNILQVSIYIFDFISTGVLISCWSKTLHLPKWAFHSWAKRQTTSFLMQNQRHNKGVGRWFRVQNLHPPPICGHFFITRQTKIQVQIMNTNYIIKFLESLWNHHTQRNTFLVFTQANQSKKEIFLHNIMLLEFSAPWELCLVRVSHLPTLVTPLCKTMIYLRIFK